MFLRYATIIVLTLFAVPAVAADMPVKAPKQVLPGYPYDNSGFYFGAGTFGGGGHVTGVAPGVNAAALVTNQIAATGVVGYTWGTRNAFYAIEGQFGVTNINGNTAGLSTSGPMTALVRGKVGIPLDTLLALFPSLPVTWSIPPFPLLPAGQTATNVHTYAFAGVKMDDISTNFGLSSNKEWRGAPIAGIGAMGQLTKGLAADAWVGTAWPTKALCVGPIACAGEGQQVLVGGGLYY